MFSLCFGSCTINRPSLPHEAPETAKSNLKELVISIAQNMQDQKLIYSSKPEDFRDCSGIFHRLLETLRKQCPNIDGPGKYNARSSRTIAGWYVENGNLKIINIAAKQAHLIKPGAVMFYGRQNQRYKNLTRDNVLKKISHIGVVVSVKKDREERIISYKLFHGRSGRKPASITNYHTRRPTRANYPPFGNGSQQWIAVAMLFETSESK